MGNCNDYLLGVTEVLVYIQAEEIINCNLVHSGVYQGGGNKFIYSFTLI